LGREVELVECAPGGELGKAQSALEPALFDRCDFVGEQVGEELRVGGLLALGGLERGCELVATAVRRRSWTCARSCW
jgi:hypothetical protein